MELKIYPLLCSDSKKAMLRTKYGYKNKWGHPYNYEPSGNLLKRLSAETLMPISEVRATIIKERKYLLQIGGLNK